MALLKRARAKKKDGTFKADDKSTPDINEAFVEEAPSDVGDVLIGPDDELRRSKQRHVGVRRLGGKVVT